LTDHQATDTMRFMSRRVGLLGGTFDPIHVGHLIVARAVRERFELDPMVVIPSARPPHKLLPDLTGAPHRLAMARLAVADEPGLEVSHCEMRRDGPSYTIDTVAEFREAWGPDAEIVWVIGADTLGELVSWHRVGELVDACRIVVAARPGWETQDLSALRSRLSAEQIARLQDNVVETPRIDVSATDIRRRIAEGRSIRWLVPESVQTYIEQHGLYRAY
jgi:nicotinate-nucleotide adenylyltransferase